MGPMDAIDIRMCHLLSIDARISYQDLADKLGISISAVHARLRTPTEEGVVKGFFARVSIGQLGGVVILVSEGPSMPP
jgi:Lrp/AsnC family transcriptional regulator, leucine-responsive regulatory protein